MLVVLLWDGGRAGIDIEIVVAKGRKGLHMGVPMDEQIAAIERRRVLCIEQMAMGNKRHASV